MRRLFEGQVPFPHELLKLKVHWRLSFSLLGGTDPCHGLLSASVCQSGQRTASNGLPAVSQLRSESRWVCALNLHLLSYCTPYSVLRNP